MTRFSHQNGYVSKLFPTRNGMAIRIKYDVPTASGKRKQKTETLYDVGRKQAKSIVRQRISEASARPVQCSELTLRAFIDGYWKPYLDREGIKPSTRKGYDSNLKNHILPIVGDMLLADIVPLDVEKLLQAKTDLSVKTLRNIIILLQSIFAVAVDNDVVESSPVRKRHKPRYSRTAKPVWTAEQIRQIINAAPAEYKPLFTCAALTGLRIGELLALRWQDVDFLNNRIRVEHSLWNGKLQSPKTDASIATVPMKPTLREVLLRHRTETRHRTDESLVFCKRDGKPYQPDVVRRDVLYPTLDRLGMKREARSAGFHTFRHSAATLVHSLTGDVAKAQKLLRHASYNTTADVYVHTDEQAQNEAAAALETAIFADSLQAVPQTRTWNENHATN